MSRIGKLEIPFPGTVKVTQKGAEVHVEGPAGKLTQTLPETVKVKVGNGTIEVQRVDDSRAARSAHGLARSLVANMVQGVTERFTRQLTIQGVGYRAEMKGTNWIQFTLGYSHPILFEVPEGVEVAVDPKANTVTLTSNDKQLVGAVAAEIRSLRPPEPYKGKGVRYTDEYIRRKEGKAGAK